MNINTGTLLGMLAPQLTNVAKQSIEKASVDGKVNLNEIIKDKSVRAVLDNLIHDLAKGTQSKESVLNLLENSKQSLIFKNFSADIKALTKAIENSPELKSNPKLTAQVNLLKNSMLDLGKIDAKSIMSAMSNSGIFLESKLLEHSIPISDVVSKALDILSKSLQHLRSSSLSTLPGQINKQVDLILLDPKVSNDIKVEIKVAVSNLLNEFSKNISKTPSLQTQSLHPNLQQIQSESKPILEKIVSLLDKILPNSELKSHQTLATVTSETKVDKALPTAELKSQLIANLQSLVSNLPQISSSEKTTLVTSILQQSSELLTSQKEMPRNIKVEIKNAVANLLRPVQTPAQTIQHFQTDIAKLEQIISQKLPDIPINSNLKPMLQELSSLLKENFVFKENLPLLKNIFINLTQKVDATTIDEQTKTTLKAELQNLSSQLKGMESLKTPEQKAHTLQNVFENLKTFSTKLETIFSKIASGQMESIPKNLASDLKGIMLQIGEQIENAKEPISKELKALVDKVGTQVEFFQLISYASNSNHTVLSFLQDNIEDSDIKFHKTDEDTFSCQIHLNLKNYGELKILLILDKSQNLGINIGIEDDFFKQKVQENLSELRSKINSVGLLLQALNVFNINSNEINGAKQIKGYTQNVNLSFGVDLKA